MSNESVTVRDSSSSATTVASNTASVADNSTSEDQYADGKAAALWNLYVGSTQARTTVYRENICRLLRSHGCYHVLDVACGTGYVQLVDLFFETGGGFLFLSAALGSWLKFRERV